MIFRETTQSDLDFLAEHTISRGIAKYQPEYVDFRYTLEHEGKPLGIGGFRLINRTTAWCWLDMADIVKGHILTAYRTITEYIDIFARTQNLRRLQAYVRTDFPEAVNLVEHLGFEKESVMKNFVGDTDAYLYVRIV